MPDPVIKYEDSMLLTNWFPNYTWYLNGNAIPQSDSQTWKPTSTGWYKVSTVRPNNSVAFSESLYIAFISIMRPDQEAASFDVFPNPTKNSFFINLNHDYSSIGKIEVGLWSMTGSLIRLFHFDGYSGPMIIPVDQVDSGMYVVTVNYNDTILRGKILITR